MHYHKFQSFFIVSNSNTSRRRRQDESAVFMIGEIHICYNSSCGKTLDIGKGNNATSISSCIKKRLSECNGLFGSNIFTQWDPMPPGSTLTLVTTLSSWTTVVINRLYPASPAQTADYEGATIGSSSSQSQARKSNLIVDNLLNLRIRFSSRLRL